MLICSIVLLQYKCATQPKLNSSTVAKYKIFPTDNNIRTMLWKSEGDGKARKYDFSYDATNRLYALVHIGQAGRTRRNVGVLKNPGFIFYIY
jgi:hypothetical protein